MRRTARPSRRPTAALWAAVLACSVCLGPARGVRAGDRESTAEIRERDLNRGRRAAIERGCRWIASKQVDGGAFGGEKALVAYTALSVLALMSQGSGVGRGPYGESIRKGVEFLVKLVEQPPRSDVVYPKGYFKALEDSNSRMHGKGYAMLALATALASADAELAPRIRTVMRRAVAVAESSQTVYGGWGYNPSGMEDHEGSVTVTVAQGLRAARDAGLHVSRQVVENGLGYLLKSQKHLGPDDPEDGSFKYSLTQDRSTYALTAAAISSFLLFGEYGLDPAKPERRKAIDDGVAYMKRRLKDMFTQPEWFYYGHFYAAWAAWQIDGERPLPEGSSAWGDSPVDGEIQNSKQFWGPWHAKVYPYLLRSQHDDGHWSDDPDKFGFGELLPTTFAVLTLAIPDELIPIFQR